MPKNLLRFFLVPVLLFVWLSGVVYAQGPEDEPAVINWQELKTENFIIVYAESIEGVAPEDCYCGIEQAQFYATFVDGIYMDLVGVFGIELETPINLRLFPTEESYYEINPLAKQITGVIAHALNNRGEIAIALPRTESLSEEELVNNMRHELTHFFASLLSDSKLNTGFQEGIAQYLEKPDDLASNDPALLKVAMEDDRLLTWAALDKAEQIFKDPQVAYPETLSIASFLIDRYGFPTFLEFIKATAHEPGYRSALETVYGKSADELETEWNAYLPDYFAGRWKINSIYAFDLSRVTELVNGGAYSDAEVELNEIIALLESTDQAETLTEAESLLAKVHQGQAAAALADETRQALLANDYQLTVDKGNAAIAAYEDLGFRDRIPEIQTYIQRAEVGQQAIAQLQQGEALLDSFRFFEAERQIHDATVVLQSLNNQTAAQRGSELLAESVRRQSFVAYGMLVVGASLLIANSVRRVLRWYSANPLEVEFS